ncbi:phage tail tape measure C-terminal domain-containing protein [Chitiniphilus eburneus]|uniref:phage tail tape measure C-terminal domain-containing protein n=1 Tax=Chitiniphilus eburneus TaxID=2571148 RepID=UPI0035CECDFA
MSTRSLGTLTLDLVARLGGFEEGMDKAARISRQRLKQIQDEAAKVGAFIGGGLAAIATVGFAVVIHGSIASAKEIANLSRLAGASAEEFQRLAAGANFVGIQQEKLADIFKDTQDKVGEFLRTGGGELKDFFKDVAPQVGVTAEQFAKLSGPESLQLFFSSLEKANLGQKEMVFYMESIADEASALIPLLADNGKGFQQIGDVAQKMGAILDEDGIQKANEFNASLAIIKMSSVGLSNQISAQLLPLMNDVAGIFVDLATDGTAANIVANTITNTFKVMAATGVGAYAALELVGKGIATLLAAGDTTDFTWYERFIPILAAKKIGERFGKIKDQLNIGVDDMQATVEKYAEILNKIWSAGDSGQGGANDLAKQLAALYSSVGKQGRSFNRSVEDNGKEAARIREAIFQSQLSLVNRQLTELAGSYANAEKIMEATRAAGLTSEKEYYDAKRAFIHLNEQAEIDALDAENALLKTQKLSGAELIKNNEKVAENLAKIASLRASASAEIEVLNIQETAAYKERQRQQGDYMDSLRKQIALSQQAVDLDVTRVGMGNRQAQDYERVLEVRQRYVDKLDELRAQQDTNDRLTEEAYRERVQALLAAQEQEIAIVEEGAKRKAQAEADWRNGVLRASQNWLDANANLAGQVDDALTNAFQGAEDALVEFVRTGKMDFKGLADSIVADITRIAIKQATLQMFGDGQGGGGMGSIVGLLSSLWGGSASTPGVAPGGIYSWFGGGRASGGPVSAGKLYEVGEGNRPELLNTGGRQYLLPGNAGEVVPLRGGGRSVVVHQNNYFQGGQNRQTADQALQEAARRMQIAMGKNG